jgi:hypothetical protein
VCVCMSGLLCVSGLGFRVSGLGFRVQGLGYGATGVCLYVWATVRFGFRV